MSSTSRIWTTHGALWGGAIAALIAGVGIWAVGAVGGHEAQHLLRSILPSIRFFCSGAMTAAATVLALMLTLLSLTSGTKAKLKPEFYKHVRDIATLDTAAFVASTVLLLVISVPLEESEEVPSSWFVVIYYTFIVVSSLIGGTLVAVILLLNGTVRDLIGLLGTGRSKHLVVDEEEEEGDGGGHGTAAG